MLSLPDIAGASGATVGGSGGCIRILREATRYGSWLTGAAVDLLMVVSREVSVLLSSTWCRWKEESKIFHTVLSIEYCTCCGMSFILVYVDMTRNGSLLAVAISGR